MIQWRLIFRRLRELCGARFAYTCFCGWYGNCPSWTDTSDVHRTHMPVCPRCFRFLR
jgi:hypothetical protein